MVTAQMSRFPMEELFCIDGKADFMANVTSAFKDLRNEQHLADVTLATEDDQVLKAHKVVLSSFSPFFKNLLKLHQHPHPLIYMKGVKAHNLQAVLDFMYYGEVSIMKKDLTTFFEVTEELKLKGLDEPVQTNLDQEDGGMAIVDSNNEIKSDPEESTKVKHKKRNTQKDANTNHLAKTDLEADGDNKLIGCSHCTKRFGSKYLLKRHMRSHAEEKPYTCTQCGNAYTEKGQLEAHMLVHQRRQGKPSPLTISNINANTQEGQIMTEESLPTLPDTEENREEEQSSKDNGNIEANTSTEKTVSTVVTTTPALIKTDQKIASDNKVEKKVNWCDFVALSKDDGGTNESVWICKLCAYKATLKSNMAKHAEKEHIEGDSNPCNYCKKSYSSMDYLTNHTKKKHKNNI